MVSDFVISNKAKLKPIKSIAKKLGLRDSEIELYGDYVAKVSYHVLRRLSRRKDGRLVLVTAVNPTSAGEGKTTITIGLAQALKKTGLDSFICIREPSLGPCFGFKGGATGGGYSQVYPGNEINLGFTRDTPMVAAANNLLAAAVDNHIYFGNKLGIDPENITWTRAMDMNDRSLRKIKTRYSRDNSYRNTSFKITSASEVMAALCLAKDLSDLRKRLGDIIVGYTVKGKPVRVKQLRIEGAMTALLQKSFNPNLVQSLEGVPAFVHGGPFANIAHGCSSLIATKTALKLADIVVTEAGFGSELGAEKFFNIKCRIGKLKPAAVVLVATTRALKHHGGAVDSNRTDLGALEKGLPNLVKHIENIRKYNLPLVVTINKFSEDSREEIKLVLKKCRELGVDALVADVHNKGGAGGIGLAEKVIELADRKNRFKYLYKTSQPIKDKIETIAREMYGARGVSYSRRALNDMRRLEKEGLNKLPICMSKTQRSLSDNPKLLGRPRNFTVRVNDVAVSSGAGFIVVETSKTITMPGLPRKPAAENIDVDKKDRITGLL